MTEWAALIAWVLTAGGGIVMLAISLSRGGMLLLVVAGLGFFMLSIWAGQRQARATVAQAATATSGPARPAEQRFPVAFVALHRIAAATTLVLVLLAAVGVG